MLYTQYVEDVLQNHWNDVLIESYSTKIQITGENIASYITTEIDFWQSLNLDNGSKIAMCIPSGINWVKLFLAISCSEYIAVALPGDICSAITAAEHSDCEVLYMQASDLPLVDIFKFKNLKYIISIEDDQILYSSCTYDTYSKSHQLIDRTRFCVTPKIPDDLALLIYTSGSSTHLKGVMLTYRNISSCLLANYARFPYNKRYNLLSILPINHIFGLMYELLLPFCIGMRIVVLDTPPIPELIIPAIRYVKPEILFGVPVILYKLMEEIDRTNLWSILSSCKMIVSGGAGVKKEFSEWMIEERKLPFYIGYGMSECSPTVCVAKADKYEKHSCGMPIDCLEFRIDSEDPMQIPGEIQVRGESVFKGYYKDAETTCRMFTEDGWFKTSDMAIISPEGNIFIKGRLDHQLSTASGKNIYLEDMESILCDNKIVKEAVVCLHDNILKAYIVPEYSIDETIVRELINELNIKHFSGAYISEIVLVNKLERTSKGTIKRNLYL